MVIETITLIPRLLPSCLVSLTVNRSLFIATQKLGRSQGKWLRLSTPHI